MRCAIYQFVEHSQIITAAMVFDLTPVSRGNTSLLTRGDQFRSRATYKSARRRGM